jgi:GAF domain-containing protein
MELNEKIKLMKFNIDTDINIFLVNLQNLFDELEKIDNDIPQNTKIGILNRLLPGNSRFINVFQYSNWKNCCQYVKRVIPEILLSNTKESNNRKKAPQTPFLVLIKAPMMQIKRKTI